MGDSEDINLTQYAMNELEALGLLKIDLLGLKNLSLIEVCKITGESEAV